MSILSIDKLTNKHKTQKVTKILFYFEVKLLSKYYFCGQDEERK